MKRLFILIALFTLTLQSYAQTSNGTVPIEIPIYNLKDGNFTMPISLSYNSAGIRTDQIASNVGLNWDLNAGARIVRVVRDKPDEAFIGLDSRGFDNCGSRWHFWGYENEPWPTFSEVVEDKFYFLRDLEPDSYVLYLNGNTIEFTLDVSSNGKNGVKVVMLRDNQDIFIEYLENEYNYLQSPVEANPTYQYEIDKLIHDYPKKLKERLCNSNATFAQFSPQISFKVTDTDGTVYYFGLDVSSREYSFTAKTLDDANYFSTNGQDDKKEKHAVAGTIISCPAAWLLSKVLKPKGVIKTFDKYKQEDKFQEINFVYERRMNTNQTYSISTTTPEIIDGCTTQNVRLTAYGEDNPLYLEAQLRTIESDNFQIKFNASEIFALESKMTNLTSMIPNYVVGDFGNFKRLDMLGSEYLPDKVNQNQDVFLNWKITINNPLKPLPKPELVRNIMILDKSTGKKLGFYLDYDYYVHQNDNRQVSVLWNDEIRLVNKRLKLKGLYPIEIGATSSKLLNGYVFNYNPTGLPIRFTPARDYWGYYNGKFSNSLTVEERVAKRNEASMAITQTCLSTVDRTPDLTFAQAGILNQIIYPTGGNVKYEYELHDADNYYTSKVSGLKTGFLKVGGLRIKRIISYDPVANKEYIEKYTYTKSSNINESSGFLSIWPNHEVCELTRVPSAQTTTGIFFTDPTNAGYKFIPFKSYNSVSYNNMLMNKYINGGYITYKEVKVEQITMVGTTEVANGSTLYEYHINEKQPYAILQNGQMNYDVDNTTVNGTCFSAYRYFNWNLPTYDFTKGLLKKVSVFKSGQVNPITTTEYQYTSTNLTNIHNIKNAYLLPHTSIDVDLNGTYKGQQVVQLIALGASFAPHVPWIVGTVINFIDKAISLGQPYRDLTSYSGKIVQYQSPVGRVLLNKIISTNYDLSGNMPVQTTTTYSYGTAHYQPTNIVTITKNSDTAYPSSTSQEKTEQVIKYVRDFGATVSNTSQCNSVGLLNMTNRRFNVPVESIAKKNDLVIGGSIKDFQCDLNLVGLEKTIYGLELANPLSSFTLSTLSNGVVSKHANYTPIVNYTEYNTKGLVTKFNREKAPVTQINYTYNNLLPSSIIVASDVPAISKTVSYEYDSPLFGLRKATAPDGTFTSTEYDNLGRVKAIRDLNGNLLKSYGYNFIARTFANISSNIILQKKSGTSFIDIKTLVENDTYQAVTGEFLNIKVTTTSTIKSIVVTFDNKFVWKSNYVNNSNVFTLFGTTGFDPSVLVNSAQKIGSCSVKVQLYSDVDGQGDLIGYKNIKFNLY